MKYKFFPYCCIVNMAFTIDIAPIFLNQEDQLIKSKSKSKKSIIVRK